MSNFIKFIVLINTLLFLFGERNLLLANENISLNVSSNTSTGISKSSNILNLLENRSGFGFDVGVGLWGFYHHYNNTWRWFDAPGIITLFYEWDNKKNGGIINLSYCSGKLENAIVDTRINQGYFFTTYRLSKIQIGSLAPTLLFYLKPTSYLSLGIEYYLALIGYYYNISLSGIDQERYFKEDFINSYGLQIQYGKEISKSIKYSFIYRLTIRYFIPKDFNGLKIDPSGLFFTLGYKFFIR